MHIACYQQLNWAQNIEKKLIFFIQSFSSYSFIIPVQCPTLLIIILIHILSFLSLLALSCFISFNIFALDGNENRGFTSSEREGGRFPGKSEKVFNFESDLDYHLLNITDGWSSHFQMSIQHGHQDSRIIIKIQQTERSLKNTCIGYTL